MGQLLGCHQEHQSRWKQVKGDKEQLTATVYDNDKADPEVLLKKGIIRHTHVAQRKHHNCTHCEKMQHWVCPRWTGDNCVLVWSFELWQLIIQETIFCTNKYTHKHTLLLVICTFWTGIFHPPHVVPSTAPVIGYCLAAGGWMLPDIHLHTQVHTSVDEHLRPRWAGESGFSWSDVFNVRVHIAPYCIQPQSKNTIKQQKAGHWWCSRF